MSPTRTGQIKTHLNQSSLKKSRVYDPQHEYEQTKAVTQAMTRFGKRGGYTADGRTRKMT